MGRGAREDRVSVRELSWDLELELELARLFGSVWFSFVYFSSI